MKELERMYEDLGVSRAVYAYGEEILDCLKPRFAAIDQNAEYNQAKVIAAMQRNQVSAACFAARTIFELFGTTKIVSAFTASKAFMKSSVEGFIV